MKLNIDIAGTLRAHRITSVASLVLAVADIVAAVALVALDMGDITFSWVTVIALGVAAAAYLVAISLGQSILLLLGSLGCAVALGEMVRVGLPSVSDLWNGIVYIGGNSQLALVFIVVLAVLALLSCVVSFGSLERSR